MEIKIKDILRISRKVNRKLRLILIQNKLKVMEIHLNLCLNLNCVLNLRIIIIIVNK